MTFLLDTHLLLWAAALPDRLPVPIRSLLEDPAHELAFSAASLWEVTIKAGLGRDDIRIDPRRLLRGLLANGYQEIPVTAEHTLELSALPPLHRDPFDRILIAQARVEGLTLLTSDELVARYGEPARLV